MGPQGSPTDAKGSPTGQSESSMDPKGTPMDPKGTPMFPDGSPMLPQGSPMGPKGQDFNGISGLLWPFVFKQILRKRVILGYRNHQIRQRISLKPDKSKSYSEVENILPHLRI